MPSTIGKEYHSNELKYIAKDDLEYGALYQCVVTGTRDSKQPNVSLVWDGNFFRENEARLHHIDEGRRVGAVYPIELIVRRGETFSVES